MAYPSYTFDVTGTFSHIYMDEYKVKLYITCNQSVSSSSGVNYVSLTDVTGSVTQSFTVQQVSSNYYYTPSLNWNMTPMLLRFVPIGSNVKVSFNELYYMTSLFI